MGFEYIGVQGGPKSKATYLIGDILKTPKPSFS